MNTKLQLYAQSEIQRPRLPHSLQGNDRQQAERARETNNNNKILFKVPKTCKINPEGTSGPLFLLHNFQFRNLQ